MLRSVLSELGSVTESMEFGPECGSSSDELDDELGANGSTPDLDTEAAAISMFSKPSQYRAAPWWHAKP